MAYDAATTRYAIFVINSTGEAHPLDLFPLSLFLVLILILSLSLSFFFFSVLLRSVVSPRQKPIRLDSTRQAFDLPHENEILLPNV